MQKRHYYLKDNQSVLLTRHFWSVTLHIKLEYETRIIFPPLWRLVHLYLTYANAKMLQNSSQYDVPPFHWDQQWVH
jgi:hypothetical protein